MPFAEDPTYLSKTRLKSDLIAHNVGLPPAASKKEVYVDLHLKHIDQKNAAEFSSDDEDPVEIVEEKGERQMAQLPDSSGLTDDDLKAALVRLGVKVGPIVASTRALYERKLNKLLQCDGHDGLNGAEKAVLYSDSEEEEEEEENAEEVEEPVAELEVVEKSELVQQENKEAQLGFQKVGVAYPQCFLPSSRLRACSSKNEARNPKWNSKNALKSSKQNQTRDFQIPAGISKTSSLGQLSGLRTGVVNPSQSFVTKSSSPVSPQAFSITQMMESRRSLSPCSDKSNMQKHRSWSNRLEKQIVNMNKVTDQTLFYTPEDTHQEQKMKLPPEPTESIMEDCIPDYKATPTRIYVTARRPIKGAAPRPIKYAYPEIPITPRTSERQEVERRLVPFYIQMLVFLTVVFILYFIYVNVEDSSSVFTLLDSFNHWSFSEETQDTQAISGQE